jgi:hypothetical protein
MKPTNGQIQKQINQLRAFLDKPISKATMRTEIERAMAYLVEESLRWSIEDTTGWPNRLTSTKQSAANIIAIMYEVDMEDKIKFLDQITKISKLRKKYK